MKALKTNFSFLNKAVELNTNSNKVFDFLTKKYCYFITEKKADRPFRLNFFLEQGAATDGAIRMFSLHIQSLLRNKYIVFHGAALANKAGKAVVFLGNPESGKSTISAIAGQKGFKLLSDEVCLVNKNTLKVAPFPIGLMKIHQPTYSLLKEHGLRVYSETWMKIKGKSRFRAMLGAKDLTEMNIGISKKECPIDRIYIFQKNGTPLSSTLPSLCFNYRFRKPLELMEDSKFLSYLLEKYLCRPITPINIKNPQQRRATYNRTLKLLDL